MHARLNDTGQSAVEAALVIAIASVVILFMSPHFFRHVKGHVLNDAALSMDRQFDPYDESRETSRSQSRSFTRRTSTEATPRANLAAAPWAGTYVGGMRMGFTDMTRGPIPGESADSRAVSSSSGSMDDSYDYRDVHQPMF